MKIESRILITILTALLPFAVVLAGTDIEKVDKMPELLESVAPEYPTEAEKTGLEGDVWLKALVASDGSVAKAEIVTSSGHEVLDKAALAAAKECRYKPALQDGQPVAVWISYKISFVLGDEKCKR
jgi:protein TonB